MFPLHPDAEEAGGAKIHRRLEGWGLGGGDRGGGGVVCVCVAMWPTHLNFIILPESI